MKALSLTQPFASLITLGRKTLETRSWRCPASLIGQRIAIHASKGFPRDARDACLDPHFHMALWPDTNWNGAWGGAKVDEIDRLANLLPRGAILCTVRITGCWSTNRDDLVERLPDAERTFGNYAWDRWMWGLADVQVFPEPIPASGKLGLWQWEPPEGALATLTPIQARTAEREAVGT